MSGCDGFLGGLLPPVPVAPIIGFMLRVASVVVMYLFDNVLEFVAIEENELINRMR